MLTLESKDDDADLFPRVRLSITRWKTRAADVDCLIDFVVQYRQKLHWLARTHLGGFRFSLFALS